MSEPTRIDRWRCEACGEIFDVDCGSHANHADGCDGSCRKCPVQCGPVTAFPMVDAASYDALAERIATLERERDEARKCVETAHANGEEQECERWAERLNFVHRERGTDGSGVDSGDALDVIEAEIRGAFVNADDDLAALRSDYADAVRALTRLAVGKHDCPECGGVCVECGEDCTHIGDLHRVDLHRPDCRIGRVLSTESARGIE